MICTTLDDYGSNPDFNVYDDKNYQRYDKGQRKK